MENHKKLIYVIGNLMIGLRNGIIPQTTKLFDILID
jgi:hypothetical protein